MKNFHVFETVYDTEHDGYCYRIVVRVEGVCVKKSRNATWYSPPMVTIWNGSEFVGLPFYGETTFHFFNVPSLGEAISIITRQGE